MVTRSTTYDYEQSSESNRERHVPIPWSRLTDATPVLGDPAQVTCAVAGANITGTVIGPGTVTVDPYAILNVARKAVYRHNVRTTSTMHPAPPAIHEGAWSAINIGDPVYYSDEQDTINGVKLNLCPTSSAAVANALFGHIVLMQDETESSYPKAAGAAGNTHVCAVEQQ